MAGAPIDDAVVSGRTLPKPAVNAAPVPHPASDSPQLSSIADAGLRASVMPKISKSGGKNMMEPLPLTGAAAMADERRYREEMERQQSQMTSLNPAMHITSALMGNTAQPMSRLYHAPSVMNGMSAPMDSFPNNVSITEPMRPDNNTASVVKCYSPKISRMQNGHASAVITNRSAQAASSEDSGLGERSTKAFTYPPPAPLDQPEPPTRGMSLPHATSRSPSTKKHRCPHCCTEFTRHHNLKSHLLTHSHEKPYMCQTCQSKFRRLHDLKRHTKLHTGERPHTCPKCNRAFARGDALARHNKGPGGCAGRRDSAGGDEDMVEGLDGGVYTEDDHENRYHERIEIEESLPKRQKGETIHKPSTLSLNSEIVPSSDPRGECHQANSYPVPASTSALTPRFQPASSSTTTSPLDVPLQLSPKHAGRPRISSVHFDSAASTFAQSGITESPKPLTPGQIDPNQQRGRSPSLATQFHQQNFGRGTSRAPPPAGLAPPQLPSMHGWTPDHHRTNAQSPGHQSFNSSPFRPLPSILTSQPLNHQPSSSPNPSSASSYHHNSGGSMREMLGSGPGPLQTGPPAPSQGASDAGLWEYIHSMEARIQRIQHDMEVDARNREVHYEARISRLREEVGMLKGQQQPNGQQQNGQQQNGQQRR